MLEALEVLLHHTKAHKVHKVFFQELHLLEVAKVAILQAKVVQAVEFGDLDLIQHNLLRV